MVPVQVRNGSQQRLCIVSEDCKKTASQRTTSPHPVMTMMTMTTPSFSPVDRNEINSMLLNNDVKLLMVDTEQLLLLHRCLTQTRHHHHRRSSSMLWPRQHCLLERHLRFHPLQYHLCRNWHSSMAMMTTMTTMMMIALWSMRSQVPVPQVLAKYQHRERRTIMMMMTTSLRSLHYCPGKRHKTMLTMMATVCFWLEQQLDIIGLPLLANRPVKTVT